MKTILIVDDNEEYRASIAEVLQMEQYLTLEAENGLIGLQMIGDHLPDLVLCDVDMPMVNGVEMLTSVKLESKFSKIPFMFLTGRRDETTQKASQNLGADLYLTKPVSMNHLTTAIFNLLNPVAPS
jgi:DNA-binding response OmpR family regulator